MTAPDPAAVAAQHRDEVIPSLTTAARMITACLDHLHGGGNAIPEPVRDAVQVLAAYGMALAANAQGRPAPDEARELLGLPPVVDGRGSE